MKTIDVACEDVETQFEAVVEHEDDCDRTARDYADAEPTNDAEYEG